MGVIRKIRGIRGRFLLSWIVLLAASATAQTGVEEEIQKRFESARRAEQRNELTRAESEYRQVLGLSLSRIGAISSRLSDFPTAERAFRECVQAIATSEEGLMGLGVNYLRAREYEKGVDVALKLLDLNPFNRDARQLLGKIYLMQRKFQDAVTELTEANRKQEDFSTSYALALAYMNLGRLDEVRKLFDRMAEMAGNTAEVHLLFGRAYREIRQANLAVEEFRKALALNPKQPRAHYYIGLTWLTADMKPEIDKALEEFKMEAAAHPKEFPPQFFVGMIYARQRNFDAAVTALKQAIELEPKNFKARYYLGLVLSVAQRCQEAIPELQKAIEVADASTDGRSRAAVHYQLGQCWRRRGNMEEALKQSKIAQAIQLELAAGDRANLEAAPQISLEAATQSALEGHEETGLELVEEPLKPGEPEKLKSAQKVLSNFAATGYNGLALLHASKSEIAKTIEYLQLASAWDDSVTDLYYNLGLAWFRQKKPAEAMVALEKAIQKDPAKKESKRLLGIAAFMAGEHAKAAEAFSSVVGKTPEKDPQAGYSLALSLVQINRVDEALELADKLLAAAPEMAELHVLKGQAYAQRGEYEPAIRAFDSALALKPAIPEVNFFAGMAYLRQSEFDKAVERFQQELKRDPRHIQAKYHIAFIAVTKNEKERAVDLLAEVIRMDPEHAEALYQLGKIQLEKGEVTPAIANLETAANLEPNKSHIFYQLYRAYTRVGRAQYAQEALERYQKLKAQSPPPQP